MVRLFIGIMLPENLKDVVSSLQEKIKNFVDAKFVERANLHISLSFLGEVNESDVENINKTLDEICGKYKKIENKTGELTFIPSLKFLRVVALDIGNEILNNLSKEIGIKIGGDTKPPHLTLCRVRRVLDADSLSKVSFDEISFVADKVSVIKSVLSRSGPTYVVIHDSYFS